MPFPLFGSIYFGCKRVITVTRQNKWSEKVSKFQEINPNGVFSSKSADLHLGALLKIDFFKGAVLGILRITSEADVQSCSLKKVFLKISQNFTRVSFLIKLQPSGLQLY